MMKKQKYEDKLTQYINNNFKDLLQDKDMNTEELQEFQEFKKVWKKSSTLGNTPKIDVDSDWQLVRSRINFRNQTKKLRPAKYFMRYAAILIAALGLTVGLRQLVTFYGNANSGYITEQTTEFSRIINLPDGSAITLNNNSTITYNREFNKTNRDVILHGEAFFNVKRNEKVAFRVFTGKSTVQVLGTKFNIKQTDTVVTVNVTAGHVKLYEAENSGNDIDLKKNEAAVFKTLNSEIERIEAKEEAIIWLSERFNFKNTPLNDVISAIANHFQLSFKPVKGYEDVKYTGNLTNKKLEEIIQLINLSLSESEDQLILTNNQLHLIMMN